MFVMNTFESRIDSLKKCLRVGLDLESDVLTYELPKFFLNIIFKVTKGERSTKNFKSSLV